VLLIDDHPLFRAGLRGALSQDALSIEWSEAASVGEALKLMVLPPAFDLVLYDWNLPGGGGGVRGLVAVTELARGAPLLVVSADEDEAVRMAAERLGALGFISKATDARALRELLWPWLQGAVARASTPPVTGASLWFAAAASLTLRQRAVLQLMARGDANKRIADQLHIAETTVRAHVSDILRILQARNRTEAVVRASQNGLLDRPVRSRQTPSGGAG
jgi:DNA-binding NarL/FixJ family response regulator